MICDDNVKVFLFLTAAICCLGVDEIIDPKHLAYAHLFISDQRWPLIATPLSAYIFQSNQPILVNMIFAERM
jgi:hypothetical protein